MVTAADGGQGPAVRASAVCKVYADGTRALDGIDLEIEQGEFVFLLGKSGAGKTTFLRLLLGEEAPSHGQLWVYGHPLGAGPPLGGGPPRGGSQRCGGGPPRGGDLPHGGGQSLQRLRRVLGPVFQDLRLVQGRTALDNVALGLWILGLPPAETGRRAHEALVQVGLGDKAGHRVETLSTGEQQRVAVARALARRPRLILADEPTGNLDPATSQEILRLFLEANRCGATVIMATHAHALVAATGKRVIVLENGRLKDGERVWPTSSMP